MNFYGREIDPIALWERWVLFPPNMDTSGPFLPLVKCPNPEHDTYKRHFQINIRDGLVHCFAQCGISGTFTKAISIIEGCNEREARRLILGHRISTPVGKRRSSSRRPTEPATTVPSDSFSSYIPAVGLEYLATRGISGDSIARWGIGWDYEDKRIVIPAQDERGITRFLIKRAVFKSQWPKYLYDPAGVTKNSLLFGACQIDLGMVRSKGVVVVEGALDAIRIAGHHLEIPPVAVLGTGVSVQQSRLLSRYRPRRIYLFLDRDTAGIHGIQLAARRLGGRYPIFICRYPSERYDPAECSREEVQRAIERAIPISKAFPKSRSSILTGG